MVSVTAQNVSNYLKEEGPPFTKGNRKWHYQLNNVNVILSIVSNYENVRFCITVQ